MATQLSSNAKHVPCATNTTESASTEHEKATMEVKVLLITPECGIDYTTLQNNGSLEWKTHRLLWIGYLKNVDNEKCYLSKVPKDVIKYIIKFFLIDDSSFSIIKYDKTVAFHHIAEYFTTKQFFQRRELKDVNFAIPFVHIWVQFGYIQAIYPLTQKECITVSQEHIKNVNLKKWVEIPDDSMKIRLLDLDFDKYSHICVEFIGIREVDDASDSMKNVCPTLDASDDQDEIVHEKEEEITPSELKHSHIFWPLAKPDDEWKAFQVGDIIDVKVK